MSALTNFDPVAIGNEIAALEAEAQSEFKSRSAKIAAILWQVKQEHPEHLDEVCRIADIGRSRRKQLLQIGRGDKTLEQSRAETKVRVQRTRAKAKAATVAAPPKAEPPKAGNGTDPDEASAKRKAAYAANEGDGEPQAKPPQGRKRGPTAVERAAERTVMARTAAIKGASADKPKSDKSKAKSEFVSACDHWLPQMSKRDQDEALKYAKDVIGRSSVPADIATDAPVDASKLN
jgi:hypothetical protein